MSVDETLLCSFQVRVYVLTHLKSMLICAYPRILRYDMILCNDQPIRYSNLLRRRNISMVVWVWVVQWHPHESRRKRVINKQWAGSRGTKLARRVLRAGYGGNRRDWVTGISLPLVVRRRMVVGWWLLGTGRDGRARISLFTLLHSIQPNQAIITTIHIYAYQQVTLPQSARSSFPSNFA